MCAQLEYRTLMVYIIGMNNLYVFKNGKRLKVLEDIVCPVCGKTFSRRQSKVTYCSRECYYRMKRIRKDRVVWTDAMRKKMAESKMGDKNPMFGKKAWNSGKKLPQMSGENHPNYKGGWIQDGYKFRDTPDGKQLSEQRRLMQESLGRELTKDEVVHHINGIKTDNRLENLQVVTRSEHIKVHYKELLAGKRLKAHME